MKLLSEACTAEESRLREAVRRIEELDDSGLRFAPVSGGITNSNWRIHADELDRDFFVKVPGLGTEKFIDRLNAAEASQRAAAAGCGAKQIWALPEDGVEVFEWLAEYRTATNDDFRSERIRRNALKGLEAYHRQSPLRLTKTIFDMVDEHLDQLLSDNCHTPRDLPFLRWQYSRGRRAFEASGYDLVPCFNDGLAANFMIRDRDDDVKIVDFEYASNNLAHYDLGIWMGEMFFDEDVELEIIEEFFGAATLSHVARTFICKAIADLKWASWAMVQEANSRLPFDYRKYGEWKYLRARSVIYDTRWEGWLRKV